MLHSGGHSIKFAFQDLSKIKDFHTHSVISFFFFVFYIKSSQIIYWRVLKRQGIILLEKESAQDKIKPPCEHQVMGQIHANCITTWKKVSLTFSITDNFLSTLTSQSSIKKFKSFQAKIRRRAGVLASDWASNKTFFCLTTLSHLEDSCSSSPQKTCE